MAERRRISWQEFPYDAVFEPLKTRLLLPAAPLCKLHRNEPGWFVGEHIHVLLRGAAPAGGCSAPLENRIERFGELGRFREKLSEGAVWLKRFTRVGEACLWNELGEVKAEVVAEAKDVEGDGGDWAEKLRLNLGEGDMDRMTGRLDLRAA